MEVWYRQVADFARHFNLLLVDLVGHGGSANATFGKDFNFSKAADQVKSFISVELSMGQMIEDVKLATSCKKPVYLCNRAGGMIPASEQVLASIKEAAEIGGAN